MSTDENYKSYVLESVIKQILYSGQSPTIAAIDSAFDAYTADKDFTKPLFDNTTANVVQLESATATKLNKTYFEIWRDLNIAYQTAFASTDKCLKAFDRWRAESIAMESKLKLLDDRISNLITTQIHHGSHYVSDVFSDMSLIDPGNTTAYVNIKDNNVTLNASTDNYTRINLNAISDDDVTFTILSRGSLQSVITAQNGDVVNAFDDRDSFWQTRAYVLSSGQPITGELKFKISDTPITISKLSCILHSANTNSAVQITPMTSTDGVNFFQLDTNNITVSVVDKASWTFAATQATHIKFIMTKTGFDFTDSNLYIYEFGAQDISVYNTGFNNQNAQILFSKALSSNDTSGNPIPFHSVQLQTCDNIPTNTNIQYWVTALSHADDGELWTSIDPLGKTNALYPSTINFGQKRDYEVPNVKISFDSNASLGFGNPALDYKLIKLNAGTAITIAHRSTITKYVLFNPEDRLLTHEIDASINVTKDNVDIFRNVGARGSTTPVRGVQRGWTFQEPYFISAIEVLNPNGLKVNFGDKAIVLDGDTRKGSIVIDQGIHTIKIRKENWISIPAVTYFTVDQLKAADPLFPFNQKLLIEGVNLNDVANPYIGVDTFAGYFMTQVSIVDFNRNIEANDYTAFAVDRDSVDTNKLIPSLVFMVKSDPSNSDFLDEIFTLRFTVADKVFNYVKFKAQLTSTDPTITPSLASYKIKLSN